MMSARSWMWLSLYLWLVIIQISEATRKSHSSSFETERRDDFIPTRAGMRAFGANSICAYCRHIGHIYCIYLYCYGGGQMGGAYGPPGSSGPFVYPYLPQPLPRLDSSCFYCQMSNNQHCIRKYCTGTGQVGYGMSGRLTQFSGFGLGGSLPERRDVMCAYCQRMNDWHCTRKYCSFGFGFAAGSQVLGGSATTPFPRLDPTCSYCQMIMDQQCIDKFCARSGLREIGNMARSFGQQVSRQDPVCDYCMRIGNQQCIRKYCRRSAVALPGQLRNVAPPGGRVTTSLNFPQQVGVTAFRQQRKKIGMSS